MDRFSAHMDRAWDLIGKGEMIQALVAAKRALEIDEESPEVHNLIGYIYAMDGDFEEAISNYRQAMTLDEYYIEPVLNIAELLIHSDIDSEEAVRLCRRVAEIVSEPEEIVEAILLEADALINMGDLEGARERLDDIEKPELLPTTYTILLGRALYEVGDSQAAKPFLERSVAEEPASGDAWYYYGQVARDEGRRVDAVRAFQNVLLADAKEPSPPWAKYLEPIEPLVRQAIGTLKEEERTLLDDTEVVVTNSPSEQQVDDEIDPRQMVLAEGIDPERGAFRRLWVFVRNLSRAGVLPHSAKEDLAEMILHELKPRTGIV
ncbi:MAG: tetratricopeptide repeat protein [Deltaproteobacteria bacterium]|nr:tetratricopeptide repeat protein [Deltaproteobacteria bacterium]